MSQAVQEARRLQEEDLSGGEPRLKRLVLADPVVPEGLAVLEAEPGLRVEDHSESSRDELRAALHGAAGLIVRSRTRVDAELLEAADSLEVIGRAGVGVDNIDLEAATRRGIAVLNAPGGNTISTAELAFGLMLAAARRIAEGDRTVREGLWERKRLRGAQLQGKTLGVIGAGRIGTEVIRRGRAFGMEILVFDPYLTAERANDQGLDRVELDELLERADVVTLHVPLNDTTRGMIGTAELARMKDDAILVNAARGGLVDEGAVVEALSSGKLGAAALDVYAEEPLPAESPLRDAPNLVMTPHLGASTEEAQREVSREIARAILNALVSDDFGAALNAPHVSVADRGRMGPVLDLGTRLGRLLAALTDGCCQRLDVGYAGPLDSILRPLAAAALEGFLSSTVDISLNLVNALAIAGERGVDVGRVRIGEMADYTNYVELRALEGADETIVGGALLGEGHHPRIVRIGGFHVDTVPEGVLLLVRNRDVPGVIGEVGTMLGAAGINIGEYHLGRKAAEGRALGVITVDDELPSEVIADLRALPAVEEVLQVAFDV
jgi:D-3-phosphoglycerate dehydrogenase